MSDDKNRPSKANHDSKSASLPPGDPETLALAAAFEAIREAPTCRALANAIHRVANLMMVAQAVSVPALNELERAVKACRGAALSLLPDEETATAWNDLAALCALHCAPAAVIAACNESGAALDWFDRVAVLTNRLDTIARHDAMREREEQRQHKVMLCNVMAAAQPGPHLH